MNLLFIGDVVGCSGTDFLEEQLYKLKREYDIDVTVVNGENSAQGNGITPESFERFMRMGVDVVTTGNHCFRRREMVDLYDSSEFLIRPANFPDGVAGRGVAYIDLCPVKIAVVNLMGTMYMEALDNPFTEIDEILKSIDTPNIFVDFHAEATSEKKAMGHYLKGRVTAVLGTHTHVQTADEVILGGHTAYITDVGMTGPELSVLGVDSDIVIEKFRYHKPVKFTESDSACFLNGVVVSFDEKSGKSTNIIRVISRK
ncbi:TIGR00282 family metallophosphoesterase [Ruminococcus albus]|uniref:Metallophosphoesterase n=1 Tax=Ruminococcus albus (strain ATCC 27210 / DSM 20455 / JCM 14654 / NCDO 2250 / 7) TaxID=697329 RepID=E6UI88_RUMA7|nr:TIGR00282 family metallophosphoesterase [Ruminococcus albus]ADU22149.1 metallophosphoesterase [Ruminococcus albus 7 = DSM 20455]